MMCGEKGANFNKCRQAKLGRWDRAMGVEGLHVDDEGRFCGAFGFNKRFSVREAGVEGNQASFKEGVKHGLD